ncbi:MAG: biotin--[acetyl-CoA-carboxylase] ligase [Bacteroidota bacterium]
MHIFKLDAIDSTNRYLKTLVLKQPLKDLTVVVARHQVKGRGQMGTQWQSEKDKNLTFSILKYFNAFDVSNQFYLNMGVSLGLYHALRAYDIPQLQIKWPNDIMSGTLKICGILVESVLQAMYIKHSIIGIGLNVNQESFKGLDSAASLKMVTGKEMDLDELLNTILEELVFYLEAMEKKTTQQELIKSYGELLFKKDVPMRFCTVGGQPFTGMIRGVSISGKLKVELVHGGVRLFGFKEIVFLG